MKNDKEYQLLWKIVAEAWLKQEFRDRFVRNPQAVLKKAGLKLAGIALVTTTVLQSGTPEITIKDKTLEISLPPAPTELSELDFMKEMDFEVFNLGFCLKICSC